ncbi:uncharacterized protein LOC121420506 isoform X1 [Lytechinus variegatus]|uniref:uncharacterized protein LOC121420506 isoform X1 n=1 Tax=Lytechinus variegatus TaxID=7654 RepID=UPI001BB1459E|nr:uncharacterized protein LOC121420506 isoform X1 [Lytechinus variegatus]
MDNIWKKALFILLVSWILFEDCHGQEVTVPESATFWVDDGSASLSCQVTGSPSQVTWSIGTDPLASWTENGEVTLPKPGGKYNMTVDGQEFDLLINNISISDALNYTCAAFGGGTAKFESSEVKVYREASEPVIKECPTNNEVDDDCRIDVANETYMANLTCTVQHFFPNVTITWSSTHGVIDPINIDWQLSDEGCYCAYVTIEARPQDDAYVCTVTGEALRDERTKSLRALVQVYEDGVNPTKRDPDGDDGGDGGSSNLGMIVGIVIGCVFLVIIVIFIIYAVRVKKREASKGGKKYKYTKQAKQAATTEEDDERRAGESRTTTGKDDNFGVVDEVDERGEKRTEDEKNDWSPETKDSDGGGGGGGESGSVGGGGGGSSHDDGGGHDD